VGVHDSDDSERPPQDPIAAWLDLMEVVEALCPEWPAREVMMNGDYRL